PGMARGSPTNWSLTVRALTPSLPSLALGSAPTSRPRCKGCSTRLRRAALTSSNHDAVCWRAGREPRILAVASHLALATDDHRRARATPADACAIRAVGVRV